MLRARAPHARPERARFARLLARIELALVVSRGATETHAVVRRPPAAGRAGLVSRRGAAPDAPDSWTAEAQNRIPKSEPVIPNHWCC